MLRFSLSPAGIKAVALWLFLPGAVVAPFLFWQNFVIGAVFLVAWLLLSLVGLPIHLRSLEGSITTGEVRLRQGVLFKRFVRLPTRCITGTSLVQTPLLRLCGCCLLIVYTSGTVMILPGVAHELALQIVATVQEGQP